MGKILSELLIEIDIRPAGTESAIIHAPFDKAKEALESKGYKIISLKENALLRIQKVKYFNVSMTGNWTREGVLYVPGEGAFLTKNSPIMKAPVEATQAHRKGIDFYLSGKKVKQSLQDSVKLSAEDISTNRFAEDEVTNYAFGEIAEEYGQFLKDFGIKKIPVWIANLQNKPFARQMWFRGLGGWSGLGSDSGDLANNNRLRGVKEIGIAL